MIRSIKIIGCFFILLFISLNNYASINRCINYSPPDTSEKAVKKIANKEAHKAAIMSTILPGLGQAYNKKYWKIPIVYAALAGMGYLIYKSEYKYLEYHNELLIRYQHGDSVNGYIKYSNPNLALYSTTDLNTQKLLYQKHFEECIIGLGFVYILNIIDASIDGHFKTFDVSDNLSLTIKPKTFYIAQSAFGVGTGISLTLNFK